jgi:coatomer subunit gamma
LWFQVAEGTDAVPPNARSHTVLLGGTFLGEQTVLVRASFGIDASGQVALKLVVRSEEEGTSEAIHSIITES